MTQQTDSPVADQADQPVPLPFPVVGVGASAGGLEALGAFLDGLPAQPGMAIIVVQHLSPDHDSILAELLQTHTTLSVNQVTDSPELFPDCVYVIPPGKTLKLSGGSLHLSDPEEPRGRRAPIDLFFRSLASEQGAGAIGVVLSGTGSDGAQGLRAIKEAGGLTLAQDPEEAAYPGMPRSAVGTGLVDLIAPARELAGRLIEVRAHAERLPIPPEDPLEEDGEEMLGKILALLRARTGHDFAKYKRSTIRRRLARRLHVNGLDRPSDYLERLRADPEEARALLRDFLISVTNFFRDAESFRALEHEAVPVLFQGRTPDDRIRVWVPGCATGEEAYSVAMLLCEHRDRLDNPPGFQIFATDLDEKAVAFAREGLYPETIAADVSPERLARFFRPEGGGYRVTPALRETVLFAVHNLIESPPFSRLDLVSCRNLLIYLQRDIQRSVFDTFHYALAPDGFLFLGGSESAEAAGSLYEPVDKQARLYRAQPSAERGPLPQFPAPAARRARRNGSENGAEPAPSHSISDRYDAWTLARHAPPRLLVERSLDVSHVYGGAGRYLVRPDGPVTRNVTEQVQAALRIDLRSALFRAFEHGETTASRFIRVQTESGERVVRLHVGPVEVEGFPEGYAEVVFEEVAADALPLLGAEAKAGNGEDPVVQHLETELATTRSRLQTLVEEYETANEELRASNEELQSMNEELQSTTEELETGKEELQSLNEELVTVNQELKTKVDELGRAYSDLQNLMAATQVATLFVDRELRLSRFTPRAADLFNVIPADLGRPLSHLSHHLRDADLVDVAQAVLSALEPQSREVRTTRDDWVMLRALPYRTPEDRIDGVVFTFVDVTEFKRIGEELELRLRQQAAVSALGQRAVEGASLDSLHDEACALLCDVLGTPFSKVLEMQPSGKRLMLRAGRGWSEGLVGAATVETHRRSQAGYTLEQEAAVLVEDVETERRFTAPSLLTDHGVRSGMSTVIPGLGGPWGVLAAHDTEPRRFTPEDTQFLQAMAHILGEAIRRRRSQDALHNRIATLDAVVEAIPDAVYIGDEAGVTRANQKGLDLLGAESLEDLQGRSEALMARFDVRDPETGEVLAPEEHPFYRALRGEATVRDVTASNVKTGGRVFLRAAAAPIFSPEGEPVGAIAINVDVSERRRMEHELRAAQEQLVEERAFLEATLQQIPIGVITHDAATGAVTFANDAVREILEGTPLWEAHGDDYARWVPYYADGTPYLPGDLPIVRATRGEEVRGEVIAFPRTDTERLYLRLSAGPVLNAEGEIVAAVAAFEDVSEEIAAREELASFNERLEEEVERRTEQTRLLTTALALAEQHERSRIAQVLHDDLQQTLYGLHLRVQLLAEAAQDDNPEGAAELDRIDGLLLRAISSARTLTLDLKPPVLPEEGFTAALRWLIEHMRETHRMDAGLTVEAEVEDSDLVLPPAMHTFLLQIVRELLFNAVKHAGVHEADVRVSLQGERIRIAVEDHGDGFDPATVTEGGRTGLGLFSVRERLDLFDGELDIHSIPHDGTRITVTLPLTPPSL